MIASNFSKAKVILGMRIIYVKLYAFVNLATKKEGSTYMAKLQIGRVYNPSKYNQNLEGSKMPKKVWAKGRKEKPCTIAISTETRDIINRLSEEARMTAKEFVALLVYRYAGRHEPCTKSVDVGSKSL